MLNCIRYVFLTLFLSASVIIVTAQDSPQTDAQNDDNHAHYGMSEDVYNYYTKVFLPNERDKNVLWMADTLCQRAKRDGDTRTMAVAMLGKLNYYYYNLGSLDSLKYHLKEVVDFSRRTKQQKYVDFALSRYVEYFISKQQYNLAMLALNEVHVQMLNDNSVNANVVYYNLLARIYDKKANPWRAAECLEKAIEFSEQLPEDDREFNLPMKYANYAELLLETYAGDPTQLSKCGAYINKAMDLAKTDYQKATAKKNLVNYLALTNNRERLEQVYRDLMSTKSQHISANHKGCIFDAEFKYQVYHKNLPKALTAIDSLLTCVLQADTPRYYDYYISAYSCVPGHEAELAELYRKKTEAVEHRYLQNSDISIEEFQIQYEVSILNQNQQRLESEIVTQKLRNNYQIMACMFVLLLVLLCGFLYVLRMKRKVSRANVKLELKHRELQLSNEIIVRERDNARKANKVKTVFIENISHEVRTPLNSIMGFSQLLAESENLDHESLRKFIQVIVDNSNLLMRLFGNVVFLSALDSNPVKDAEPEMHQLVSLNSLCASAKQRVLAEFSDEAPINVVLHQWKDEFLLKTDGQLLSQALHQIVDNAIQFTPKGGTITIECGESADGGQFIAVSDTGCGVPEGMHSKIFDRFVKMDSTSQGLGIGLSIAKICCENIGATLSVDESYTDGARMVITLHALRYREE